MCVQVTKSANRFEISSLLEKILLKQVRWCLTFVGLYILKEIASVHANKVISIDCSLFSNSIKINSAKFTNAGIFYNCQKLTR